MVKIIGLTGGIGSGKTSVMNYIESLGYDTYYTDNAAKRLMDTEEMTSEIIKKFQQYDISSNGQIDRRKLASIVFKNPELLENLNQIVHPAVEKDFIDFVEKNRNKKIIFKESAILFESGSFKNCDASILITAPLDIRINRVMQRDNITKEEVLSRVKNQLSDEEKAKLATYIVENIKLEETFKNVDQIINKILIN